MLGLSLNASYTKQSDKAWFPKTIYDFSCYPQIRVLHHEKDTSYTDMRIKYNITTGKGVCTSYIRNGRPMANLKAVPSLRGIAKEIQYKLQNDENVKIRYRAGFSARHSDPAAIAIVVNILKDNLATTTTGNAARKGILKIAKVLEAHIGTNLPSTKIGFCQDAEGEVMAESDSHPTECLSSVVQPDQTIFPCCQEKTCVEIK